MSTSITLEGFYRKAGKLIPWFMSAALVLFVGGVYLGFFVCPIEARLGNSYRIIFIQIPAWRVKSWHRFSEMRKTIMRIRLKYIK